MTSIFKWKHFESEIILLCVRWYLKYPLSYRNLVEMIAERGLSVSHTAILGSGANNTKLTTTARTIIEFYHFINKKYIKNEN